MFAKLKKQVKEKSDDLSDIKTPEVTQKSDLSRRTRVKSSSVSDENLDASSDEKSSTKSRTEDQAAANFSVHVNPNPDENNQQLNETTSEQPAGKRKDSNNNQNNDNSYKSQLQQLNQSLLNQIDVMASELKEKLRENEDLRVTAIKLSNQLEEYEDEIRVLKNDKDELIIRNAELSEKYELLKHVNAKEAAQQHSEHSLETKLRSHSESTAPKDEQPTIIPTATTDDTITKSLRDELNEKNKVIKNLQQRLNDLKKTLQKELKYQQLPNEAAKPSHAHSSASDDMLLQKTPTRPVSNGVFNETTPQQNALKRPSLVAASSGGLVNGVKKLDDVNNKYLKHVIFKFLTSREYEAIHLVKAISMLLNFTAEEEKALKESLEWKMSWFGTKPKLANIS